MNCYSQQPPAATPASTDVPIGLRIADLKREIEGIRELNMRKRHLQGWREFDHFYPDHVACIRIARHLNTLSFVLLCFRAISE